MLVSDDSIESFRLRSDSRATSPLPLHTSPYLPFLTSRLRPRPLPPETSLSALHVFSRLTAPPTALSNPWLGRSAFPFTSFAPNLTLAKAKKSTTTRPVVYRNLTRPRPPLHTPRPDCIALLLLLPDTCHRRLRKPAGNRLCACSSLRPLRVGQRDPSLRPYSTPFAARNTSGCPSPTRGVALSPHLPEPIATLCALILAHRTAPVSAAKSGSKAAPYLLIPRGEYSTSGSRLPSKTVAAHHDYRPVFRHTT
ncbi:hypothetical protein K456DRAFT_137017 [Colletotrichum gloeosporioides 23]|nr:hypothetical protein K456DRAFT_137017 [Colletotrichum gloeosporioides 23]